MPEDNVIDLAARRRRNTPQPFEASVNSMLVRATSFGFAQTCECDGLVHWFEKVPGPCKCGKETWDGEP